MTSPNVETWPFEPAVREVVALLAGGKYAAIERLTGGVRLTAADIRRAVKEYPHRPAVPPPELAPPLDVVEIRAKPGAPRAWSVDVGMWSVAEGRSDLTLQLTVRADPTRPGGFAIEFDDLHVL